MTRLAATVLLDLDGTLSDNYVGIAGSIRHALAALGVADVADAELRGCVGPPLRHSFARLLDTAEAPRIEQALALYRDRYRDVGWRENVLYEGVPEALAALARAGCTLYLCTSKPQPFAERIVAHFGLDVMLAGVYGADLAGAYDDKKLLMRHLIATEGLHPGRCVMVGDRYHDMHAAAANGLPAIGVLWGYGSRQELAESGAAYLIDAPAGLLPAVARVLGAALPVSATADPR
ncbi:MAG: HAD hydrolase-like protein [Casimicrobiaceae bacterium]